MGQKGTTMIELIIALSITVLVMWVLVYSYLAVMDVFGSEVSKTDIEIEGSRAMSIVSKEIRELNEIQSGSATAITFWGRDLNGNGTKEAGEIITYSWDGTPGGSLVRTVAGAGKPIARLVWDFSITYDNPSPALAKQLSIKIVNASGDRFSTKESTIAPRNL